MPSGVYIRTKPVWNKGLSYPHTYAKIKPLLQPTSDLAYVLGVLKGDGCIYVHKHGLNRGSTYEVTLQVASFNFASSSYRALQNLGLNPRLRATHPIKTSLNQTKKVYYVVSATSSLFYHWYKQLDFVGLEKILESQENQISFLRGFYESEGSLCCNGKNRNWLRVKIGNENLEIMRLVRLFLKNLGLRPKPDELKPEKRGWSREFYEIGLYRDADKFVEIVEPCIKNAI